MRSPRGRGCAPDDRFRTSGATPHITDGAAVASSGLLVGIGASPAWAAPADDCDVANTVTAPGEGAAEIQALHLSAFGVLPRSDLSQFHRKPEVAEGAHGTRPVFFSR